MVSPPASSSCFAVGAVRPSAGSCDEVLAEVVAEELAVDADAAVAGRGDVEARGRASAGLAGLARAR